MDQGDRRHVVNMLNGAGSALQILLRERSFALSSDALAELVNNFGGQLAYAFEAERERALIEAWNKGAEEFRQNLLNATRLRYERRVAEERMPIVVASDLQTAEEMCPRPPDFPAYFNRRR